MKSVSRILMVIIVLLSSVNGFAQTKNEKIETVKIYGNCEMCKATIEKAGNLKKIANVEWNKDTKMATLTYDSNKTNTDEILKRIALAGYDSEKFRAPDDIYVKLPECCQYIRALKPVAKSKGADTDMKTGHSEHSHGKMTQVNNASSQNVQQMQAVFDHYFAVKEALVKTNAATASSKAVELVTAIKAVEMNKLTAEEHAVWMKFIKELTADAESISKSKDVSKQRETFALLSQKIYELIKVSKLDTPIYYQHCPMYNNGKGASWLSKENVISNPYCGSKMMTCGSTKETIDNG